MSDIEQRRVQSPTTKNYPAPNVNSAKVEKPIECSPSFETLCLKNLEASTFGPLEVGQPNFLHRQLRDSMERPHEKQQSYGYMEENREPSSQQEPRSQIYDPRQTLSATPNHLSHLC